MTEQERYESEIDNAIAIKGLDKVEYSDILVCSNTPTILKDIGLEDLPILFSRKYLYIAIKEKNYKKHYKGLSVKEHIYCIPQFLSSPAIILNDINDKHAGDILIVANATQGFYKNVLKSNYMITILGYNYIEDLIEKAIENTAIIYYNKQKIQEIDQFTGKKVSNALSSLESNTILQQYTKKVK